MEVTRIVCFSNPPLSRSEPVVSKPFVVSVHTCSTALGPADFLGVRSNEPTRPVVMGTTTKGLPSCPGPMGITRPMMRFFQEKDTNLLSVRWAMNSIHSRAQGASGDELGAPE